MVRFKAAFKKGTKMKKLSIFWLLGAFLLVFVVAETGQAEVWDPAV